MLRHLEQAHRSCPVRLLIVESHPLARVALRSLLALRPDLSIAGEASDAETGLAAYLHLQPDVTIVGERPHIFDPADLVGAIRRHDPGAHFLFLRAKAPPKSRTAAASFAAVSEDATGAELSDAIRALVDGGH